MSVRDFPHPEHKRPAGWPGAWCRWCGLPIRLGGKQRKMHDGREGEPDCRRDRSLHINRTIQVAFLIERDGDRCAKCGATGVPLEFEHKTPLWLTTHLPPAERRPYFHASRCWLLCVPCHKPKTQGEATARAKSNRQASMRLDVPRPPPKMKSGGKLSGGRPLPGKGQGPRLRSRNDLRRR